MDAKKLILLLITGFVTIIILVGFGLGWWKECWNYFSVAEQPQNTIQKTTIDGWEFPKEEGEHQNLQSEWWYFAGHLEEKGIPENKFGVTLIFYKNPAFIAVNLTDGIHQKNFSSVINIDRYDLLSGEKLAIKKGENYWLEYELFKYKIYFEFEGNEIELSLDLIKDPFVRYNTADAFYYQQTRVKVEGKLSFPGKEYRIKGFGWIDHQGFKESVPWESWRWQAIQLDNNTEIVLVSDFVFKLEKFEKSASFIFNNHQGEIIQGADYSIENLDYWVDSETGYQYPVKFRLKIPAKNADLEIATVVNNQVIEGTQGFYEGSCQVTGIFEGQSVTGRAQLEVMPPH